MKIADLHSSESHEKGAECPIKDETGRITPLRIIVKGKDSKAFRMEQRLNRRAILDAMSAGKLDDIDEEARDIDTLVNLTVGWKGTDEKFTKKLCKTLYTKAPYVRDQVDTFIGDRANFTRG